MSYICFSFTFAQTPSTNNCLPCIYFQKQIQDSSPLLWVTVPCFAQLSHILYNNIINLHKLCHCHYAIYIYGSKGGKSLPLKFLISRMRKSCTRTGASPTLTGWSLKEIIHLIQKELTSPFLPTAESKEGGRLPKTSGEKR